MPPGRKVWLALLGAGGGVEVYGILHPGRNDTLSEFIHWAFRVDTTPGAVLFVIATLGFTAWFIPHILNLKRRK